MKEEDIKSSVRLPKTSFAMKANLSDLEGRVLQKWQEEEIYKKISNKNAGRKKFILHDGPPYANGHLHVGHALNKILKDIIVRSYLNLGYDAPFVPGWDCHGLPIEWKIEEKYKAKKLSKNDVEINTFRKECEDFAKSWIDIQKEEFKSLGILGDFENPYITMNYQSEAIIVEAIFNILKQGLLYQGKKPVMWSPVEQTALAEAEVEYKDKTSDTIYVGFKVAKTPNKLWQGAYATIWTTTPWTIPANQAIAYSKDIEYSLIKVEAVAEDSLVEKGTNIVVASDLAEEVLSRFKIVQYTVLDKQKGLKDFELEHPLYGMGYDFLVPALEADFVETTTGTGIVHMAPAHGEDDFYLCKKYNIVPKEYVLDNGTYVEDLAIFANEHIFKVAPKVIDSLRENKTLFANSQITHSYPHSWRSKAPLVYRLTTQWFISLDKKDTRKKAIDSLEKIDFMPKTGKNRLKSMLENRPDWCVSRQRAWGVPLSLFINKKTKEPLMDEEVFNRIIEAFKENGASSWFSEDPKRFLGTKYNHEEYESISDVIDVWVDSGLSNAYVLKARENLAFPADVYLEGSDQHRGWFQSSLVMSLLLFGVPPYKKILTHGFILDEAAQKMSKSLGNVITPASVLKEYGADILRIWVASSNFMEDVSINKNILAQQADSYRKIRNTLRYLLANISNFKEEVAYDSLEEIDHLILHQIFTIDGLFENTFKNTFTIHLFFNKVLSFIQSDLSAFYFDIKKDILYCDSETSPRYLGTLSVLNTIFQYLTKWLSPFIPFTIEEAYALYKNEEVGGLFLSDFAKASAKWENKELEIKWNTIKKARKVVTGAVEQARAKKAIGSSLESAPIIYASKEIVAILKEIDFAEICITSSVEEKESTNLSDGQKEGLFSLGDVENVYVEFVKDSGEKCIRCWKFFDKLEDNNLCTRCSDALKY